MEVQSCAAKRHIFNLRIFGEWKNIPVPQFSSRFPVNEMWKAEVVGYYKPDRPDHHGTAQESQCLVDSYISTVLRSVCFFSIYDIYWNLVTRC